MRLLLGPLLALAMAIPGAEAFSQSRVLVFSKTAAFRHDSIPSGITALRAIGREQGLAVDATEDASVFTAEGLRPYSAVVFLSTTGDVLSNAQQDSFRAFIEAGGGFVGIHAASDTEYDWPWYGSTLLGTYFAGHGAVQTGRVQVEDGVHPSTRELPESWRHRDEWYDFRTNVRGKSHVLMTVDGESISGSSMDDDHPVSWCHAIGSGHSWYTALGHTSESFRDDRFRSHLAGGLTWAVGRATGDCN